jgi:hypothetical protein
LNRSRVELNHQRPRIEVQAEPEIFCPACGYRPGHEDRWNCVPSCGTVWNTFWTRGVCPGCSVKWPKTQCPSCAEYSLHEAWYHYPSPADAEREDERLPAEDMA